MTQIAIVGEAWGEEEERQRAPFVGPAGYALTRMLEEAGIRRADCFLTNVFNLRPGPRNDIETLCCDKAGDRIPDMPMLRAGKYIRREYSEELARLYGELRDIRPNVTIALGNTASWALLRNSGISKIRGSIAANCIGGKTLATYHPAAVLRQWDLRPITVMDLAKAKRESEFPDIRLPQRQVFIEPDLTDLEWFYGTHIYDAKHLAVDIETANDAITCIGFAPSTTVALVVPFWDLRRGGPYWHSIEAELAAWEFVERVLRSPIPKVFQNGIYDMHYLWRRYGIVTRDADEDTMLLHHALHPESEKGLGFLGSIYTNEASWKLMRTSTLKREA